MIMMMMMTATPSKSKSLKPKQQPASWALMLISSRKNAMNTSRNILTSTTWPHFASASRKHNPRYRYTSRPAPRAPPAVTHLGAAKSNTQKLKEGPSKKELVNF